MAPENSRDDTIALITTIAVGLGVLFLAPGLGILYFLVITPIQLAARRRSASTAGAPVMEPMGTDYAPPGSPARQPSDSQMSRPARILVSILLVYVSLMAAFIAFGVICTAGVLTALAIDEAAPGNDPFESGVILVVPVISLLAAIGVFAFLIRKLVVQRK